LSRRDRRGAGYFVPVMLLGPLVVLAVVVGVAEILLGTSSELTRCVVRPFLWAVERGDRR